MNFKRLLVATAIVATLSSPAFADDTNTTTPPTTNAPGVQRDVNQQDRIEQGLQSGQLNTKEAGKLENGETRIDNTEARDMKDGSISTQEQKQLTHMENKESAAIYGQKHDAQKGNPDSASSERMQKDVQRDANQQTRINQGLKSGSMTGKEAAWSERGQARDSRMQARASRNGRVGAWEQRRLQHGENANSRRIFGRKHNRRTDTTTQ